MSTVLVYVNAHISRRKFLTQYENTQKSYVEYIFNRNNLKQNNFQS